MMRINKKYANPDIEIIILGTSDIMTGSQGTEDTSTLTPMGSNAEGLGLNEFTY